MRTIIEVQCTDQVLEVLNDPVVASGGRHEDFILYSFCSQWDGFTKTGVFYREGKSTVPYYSPLTNENLCEIPHEITEGSGTIYFGVFGVLGDVVRTSAMMKYKVKEGAITEALQPTDPTPGIWEQLLKSYSDVLDAVEESNEDQRQFINEANKSVDKCHEAANECYVAIAQLNYTATDLDGGDPSTEEVSTDVNDIEGGSPY